MRDGELAQGSRFQKIDPAPVGELRHRQVGGRSQGLSIVERRSEYRARARQKVALRVLPLSLADVTEHQDYAQQLPLGIADGGRAVVYWNLRAGLRAQDGVIGEPDDLTFAQYFCDRAF